MPEYHLDISLARDTWRKLDAFTQGYVEAAMWTLTDTRYVCDYCGHTQRNEPDMYDREDLAYVCPKCEIAAVHEESDNADYLGLQDIADSTIRAAIRDCAAFQETYRDDLADASIELGRSGSDHGQDFWLTREGHGAGFWDRGYSKALSQCLTDGAHAFGSGDWYVGDDGKVYQAGDERYKGE